MKTLQRIPVPEYPQSLSFGFSEGFCNLRCPKCPVHGDSKEAQTLIRGNMNLQEACKLFDELKGKDVVVAGNGYSEPLLQKDCWDYLKAMKDRGLAVNLNTNGLLMTEEYAKRIIDLKIDCIFVSIDATTKETLNHVRSTPKLEKVHEAVFHLLKARGETRDTRIGVSFVVEEINRHEMDHFVNYWIQHVDAVRVAEAYISKEMIKERLQKKRKPCSILYTTMLIHNNGNTPLCCWDGHGMTKVGNVFKTSIKDVWHGEEMEKARYYHETGQFDKVPFCKNCNDWMRNDFAESEIKGDVLIRRSPLLTYYNRIDRLTTWKFGKGSQVKENELDNKEVS